MNLIQSPAVNRTRRNHGLEHATIHVLAARGTAGPLAGYSTPSGFFLIGNLNTDEVISAVDEALHRLRSGQRHLAVHPGCGTNYATSGILAGTLALASTWWGGRRQSKIEQLSNAAFAATIGVLVGQALGKWLQTNITTSGDMTGVSVARVTKILSAPARVHFVATSHLV